MADERLKFSLGAETQPQQSAAQPQDTNSVLGVADLDQFNQHMMLTVRAINQMKSIFTTRGS